MAGVLGGSPPCVDSSIVALVAQVKEVQGLSLKRKEELAEMSRRAEGHAKDAKAKSRMLEEGRIARQALDEKLKQAEKKIEQAETERDEERRKRKQVETDRDEVQYDATKWKEKADAMEWKAEEHELLKRSHLKLFGELLTIVEIAPKASSGGDAAAAYEALQQMRRKCHMLLGRDSQDSEVLRGVGADQSADLALGSLRPSRACFQNGRVGASKADKTYESEISGSYAASSRRSCHLERIEGTRGGAGDGHEHDGGRGEEHQQASQRAEEDEVLADSQGEEEEQGARLELIPNTPVEELLKRGERRCNTGGSISNQRTVVRRSHNTSAMLCESIVPSSIVPSSLGQGNFSLGPVGQSFVEHKLGKDKGGGRRKDAAGSVHNGKGHAESLARSRECSDAGQSYAFEGYGRKSYAFEGDGHGRAEEDVKMRTAMKGVAEGEGDEDGDKESEDGSSQVEGSMSIDGDRRGARGQTGFSYAPSFDFAGTMARDARGGTSPKQSFAPSADFGGTLRRERSYDDEAMDEGQDEDEDPDVTQAPPSLRRLDEGPTYVEQSAVARRRQSAGQEEEEEEEEVPESPTLCGINMSSSQPSPLLIVARACPQPGPSQEDAGSVSQEVVGGSSHGLRACEEGDAVVGTPRTYEEARGASFLSFEGCQYVDSPSLDGSETVARVLQKSPVPPARLPSYDESPVPPARLPSYDEELRDVGGRGRAVTWGDQEMVHDDDDEKVVHATKDEEDKEDEEDEEDGNDAPMKPSVEAFLGLRKVSEEEEEEQVVVNDCSDGDEGLSDSDGNEDSHHLASAKPSPACTSLGLKRKMDLFRSASDYDLYASSAKHQRGGETTVVGKIIYEDLPEGDGWDDEQDACESRPSSKGARGKHGPNKFKSSSSQHFKSSHVPLKASMQHFKDFPRSNLFDGVSRKSSATAASGAIKLSSSTSSSSSAAVSGARGGQQMGRSKSENCGQEMAAGGQNGADFQTRSLSTAPVIGKRSGPREPKVNQIIRNKEQRKTMKAIPCRQCGKFLAEACDGIHIDFACFCQEVGRHRHQHTPPPSPPKDWYDVGMSTQMSAMIREKTEGPAKEIDPDGNLGFGRRSTSRGQFAGRSVLSGGGA